MFFVVVLDEFGQEQFLWQRVKPFMNGFYGYRWNRDEQGDVVLMVETVQMYKIGWNSATQTNQQLYERGNQ